MAMHFARGIINGRHLASPRLSASARQQAQHMPAHRRARFLASRSLLAELMFMLYGINTLPEIVLSAHGRPTFVDSSLCDFSIAYAGNMVGVVVNTEGRCGLGMALQRALRGFHHPHVPTIQPFASHEATWINNQNDPYEAGAQLTTLRQSVLKLCGNEDARAQQLQLLPGSGRLRLTCEPAVEALSDAEELLIWSVTAVPDIEQLDLWEYDALKGWTSLPDVASRHQSVDARLMRFTSLPVEKALILS